MKSNEGMIVVILAVVVMTIFFIPMINSIEPQAKVSGKGVGIFSNAKCTLKTNVVEWGNVYPNQTKEIELFVKNELDVIGLFNVSSENWIPEKAKEYIIFYSKYPDYYLKPDESMKIILKLFVKPDIIGIEEFSFDIIITGFEFEKPINETIKEPINDNSTDLKPINETLK